MKPLIIIGSAFLSLIFMPLTAQSDFDSLPEVQVDNILREVVIEESTIEVVMPYISPDPEIRLFPSDSWGGGDHECSITEVTEQSLTLVSSSGEVVTVTLLPAEFFSEFLEGKEGRIVTVSSEAVQRSYNANDEVRVFLEDTLVLGYIWNTAAQPLSMSDNEETIIQQEALGYFPGGDTVAQVAVQVNTDDGPVSLAPGETLSFYHGGRSYKAYLIFSEYLPESHDLEDSRSGYLFHAILTSASADDEQLLQENNPEVFIHDNSGLYSAEEPEASVKAYPNPATGYVIFEVGQEVPVSLEIYDITADQKFVAPLRRGKNRINLGKGGMPQGMYFWVVKTPQGEVFQSGRLVLQQE